jgi:hypothetical protein
MGIRRNVCRDWWGGLTRAIVVVVVVVAAAAASAAFLVPPAANAAFMRPFLRQITRTETNSDLSCSAESPRSSSCLSPGGVTIDSLNNLWVGNGEEAISEFGPSGTFVSTVKLEGNLASPPKGNYTFPEDIAVDRSSGHIYIIGKNREGFSDRVEVYTKTGEFVEQWRGEFGGSAALAIDNSTDPSDHSSGSVYVGDEPQGKIDKFTASGKLEAAFGVATRSIAVDAQGDVYGLEGGLFNEDQVNEYSSGGLVIRSFGGGETPGLGEDHQDYGGFGGQPVGIAIDPVSGHVLVSVRNYFGNEGAVDEFDSSGHFLNQITETEVESSLGVRKANRLHSALALTVDLQGDLYVVDGSSGATSEGAVDVYGPGKFFPGLKLTEVAKRESHGATLNGSVNPEGQTLNECYFEYVTEAAYKATGFADLTTGGKVECEPEASNIPSNSMDDPVKAQLTRLVSGTVYRYRLVATDAGALGGSSASVALAFTTPDLPRIDSTSVANQSSAFADLRAEIDPVGADTSYRFEYVDAAHYNPEAGDPYAAGATAPVTPADIGSGGATGSVDASVVQQIGGLAAGTTYHFRVVASNEIGTALGAGGGRPDATFTTLPRVAAGLPDNRAYELVTPTDKGGASDMFGTESAFVNTDSGYPSETGDEFLLSSTLADFGSFGGSEKTAYVFRRDAGKGWTYTSVVSPSLGVQSVVGTVFDPSDLSQGIGLTELVGSYASPAGASHTTLVGHPGGPYAILHMDLPVHEEPEEQEVTTLVGGSRDLAHVVLESKNHMLAPGDTSQDPGSDSLYERVPVGIGGCTTSSTTFSADAGGCVELINDNGEGGLVSRCGAMLGLGHGAGFRHNAVSSDGSKVFFLAPDPFAKNIGPGCWDGGGGHVPQLYMRSSGTVIKLSEPEEGWTPERSIEPAIYVGASDNGSKVFFLTETELTRDDAGIHDLELYECEIVEEAGAVKCRLTRVSSGETGKAAAGVWTVPAVSADGSAVYFTAFGQLAPGLPVLARGFGEVYLYRYDTVTGKTTYVATVGENDIVTRRHVLDNWYTREVALNTGANWYTTPDGRYLLFATARELTGYRTVEAGPGDCPFEAAGDGSEFNGHCAEVYRYHYEPGSGSGGSIVCVSCNPSGAPPMSNAQFASRSASLADQAGGPMRALSDDGSYAFFDTADGLVPQDQNHTLDVYEWHEDVSHEDTISLISSGQDPAPSFFMGASADGSNVFVGTHARLVPQDGDSAGDLYDARICEPDRGNPCIKPPTSGTGQCAGDACHNPPSPPIDAPPISLTFSGAGNVPPPSKTSAKPRSLTRAQQLAKALRACTRKPKGQRKKCDSQAHRRYGKKAQRSVRARHAKTSGRRSG